jgi:hypothetical protein
MTIYTILAGGYIATKPDGSSAALAAVSGYQLKQDYPNLSSGTYWIKSPSMPNALQN